MKKRNLNKFMGLILSAIMIVSTAFITVNADAVNTIDFTQDFENATADNCGLVLSGFDFKTVQLDNSKVLEVFNTAGNYLKISKEFDTAINNGKLAVDFTMRIAPRQYSRFMVYDSNGNKNQIFNVYFNKSSQFALGVSSTGYPYNDFEPHWIKVHFIFDLDNKKIKYIITNEYDNIIADITEKSIGFNDIQKIEIATQRTDKEQYDDVPVYLDDIRITNTNITDLATVKAELSPIKAKILPIYDDFNSYADINAVKSAWQVNDDIKEGDHQRDTTIVNDSEGKRIKLNGYDAGVVKSIASNPIESGKIKVSADVEPYSAVFGLLINGNTRSEKLSPLFYFAGEDKVYSFDTNPSKATRICDFSKGTKYHLEANIDMDAKKMSVKVAKIDGSNSTTVDDIDISQYQNKNVDYINGFGIQNYGSAAYDTMITYFDNFKVAYSGLAAPSLTNDKIGFYDDDIKGNADDVSPNTNKITLDFGTVMDQFSLYNKIRLIDSNGANVPYKATFSKNVYTLKIPGRLKASETYTLTVPANVKNELDGVLENEFSMTFKTNAGEVSATISPKNAAGDVISGLSDLSAGNEVKAEISYKNSTGKSTSAVAIFSYFENDKLQNVSLEPVTISADNKTGVAAITHKVKDLTGTTSMKIMFWDINTIEPFAEYIDLK